MSDARPPAFSALWVEGALGPFEVLSLRSFVAAGCHVELHTYDDTLVAPPGVALQDARDTVPEERLRIFPGGFAHFSNYFRYRLLSDRTTIWIDTDLVLLDLDMLPDRSHLFGLMPDGHVNTALLALPTGSPTLPDLVQASDVPEGTPLRWGRLGPQLLETTLRDHHLLDAALPAHLLYPVASQDNWRLFDPRQAGWCRDRTRGSAALHLWNQFLTKDGLKEHAPPPRSFLGQLAARFDVDFTRPKAPRSVLRQVRRKRAGGGAHPLRHLRRLVPGRTMRP